MEEIRTERLRLRPPLVSDAPAITACVNDPRIYEKVARIAPGQTVKVTTRWLEAVARGRARDLHHVFAIEKEGDFAGIIGAHRSDEGAPFEIGYWLAPPFWGQGLATEAGHALVSWLEESCGAKQFTSGYFADNPASGRVLEKLGFRKSHNAPLFCLGRGRDVDHVFMVRGPKTR
ncbi:MAG: GNAT family N-acetyltransferase [Henriciella sp.]|jgi:RimJ/RimL family protein N-acetyltransferase|uniref:GNAT family N-acetyltransferase n=1 Tax=uncultured Henriciella sp. TaxID=1608424 RepID=UPI000C3D2CFA|nr:GNAT family N-acetyltransferase [Henriciella sp.]MAN74801.1 GNAT family N-acetyltransferase [Henriciella sp.]MBF32799.1 GNAT family N-acetyltransferase [Hyphomonadaceae bacterium]MBK75702.1 GNAT family N-acetyltransferase [Henriciella sp.]|tara:strand:+ start:2440 stop:2964 length:525 start_codon:yes stop_codon:yes gene_type:complete